MNRRIGITPPSVTVVCVNCGLIVDSEEAWREHAALWLCKAFGYSVRDSGVWTVGDGVMHPFPPDEIYLSAMNDPHKWPEAPKRVRLWKLRQRIALWLAPWLNGLR